MSLEDQLFSGQLLKKENLSLVLLLIFTIVILSSLGITWLEPDFSFPDALWWSMVTLTTVGYGDLYPKTLGGRLIAVVVMVAGIGLLTTSSITISATVTSVLINRKLKEEKGMNSYQFERHIIFCEWNDRARAILLELRSATQTKSTPIILIAEADNKPLEDRNLFFIRGNINDETLNRANVSQASTVIILGDDRLEPSARDAKVVLSTLTVESLNPDTYTIVELTDERYLSHCERANADEIIISSGLSSMLISQATLNHGVSKVFTELMSPGIGNHTKKISLPQTMVGIPFLSALNRTKKEQGSIIIAIEQKETGEILCNPPEDYVLQQNDSLIVITRLQTLHIID